MASPSVRLRRRAWVERARVAALAERILEVDHTFHRFDGQGVLTSDEARALRVIAQRLAAVPR